MSVQFGRWTFDGRPPEPDYLEAVRRNLAPYDVDGQYHCRESGIEILYFPFHTTRQSRQETRPLRTTSGAVITWDGRLDNRSELLRDLGKVSTDELSDAEIAAECYGRWGQGCFARLLGDWALAICNPRERQLVLAKDFLGTRPLFYVHCRGQITWSSVLDPLVLCSGRAFAVDEEYLAGWLSFFPAAHLTPYVGVHSVPPSSLVTFTSNGVAMRKYWDFRPDKKIRYRHDGEYEEHFRSVFGESVRRRLRSDSPVLAELSGGMDSSSIVCVADDLIKEGYADLPRLDTISYYNDSEPNWNEKPYFSAVERRRGRTGRHIAVGPREAAEQRFCPQRFSALPRFVNRPDLATQELIAVMFDQQNRVVLSGIGGDEVLGGVPTPIPELADLLAAIDPSGFLRALVRWSLAKRVPLAVLLFEVLETFLPGRLSGFSKQKLRAPWLTYRFRRRHRRAIVGYAHRLRFFGPHPSFEENQTTLEGLRRQLSCMPISLAPPSEKRYPYLDRDLLEFLFAIPRQQILRPLERRSLMRRALSGVVPVEILQRKRKAFVVRQPIAALLAELPQTGDGREMAMAALGVIDQHRFAEALARSSAGTEGQAVTLLRTLILEHWLRQWRKTGLARLSKRTTIEGWFSRETSLDRRSVNRTAPAQNGSGTPAEREVRTL